MASSCSAAAQSDATKTALASQGTKSFHMRQTTACLGDSFDTSQTPSCIRFEKCMLFESKGSLVVLGLTPEMEDNSLLRELRYHDILSREIGFNVRMRLSVVVPRSMQETFLYENTTIRALYITLQIKMPLPILKWPNILISGVPATGKSTLAEKLVSILSFYTYIDINRELEKQWCYLQEPDSSDEDSNLEVYSHDGKLIGQGREGARKAADAEQKFRFRDIRLQTWLADIEQLVINLSPELNTGAKVIDWIHADVWPPDAKVDLVVTMTAETETLFDRYSTRGYNQEKIDENIDTACFREIQRANEEYWAKHGVDVVELRSDSEDDIRKNVDFLVDWINDHQTT